MTIWLTDKFILPERYQRSKSNPNPERVTERTEVIAPDVAKALLKSGFICCARSREAAAALCEVLDIRTTPKLKSFDPRPGDITVVGQLGSEGVRWVQHVIEVNR